MRTSAYCALWMAGALALAALPAFAQDSAQTDNGALVPETQLTPEESAILGNALVFDPVALATPPKKPAADPRNIRHRLRCHPHRETGRIEHHRCEATAPDRMEQLGGR